jgi:hypothetical protein
VLAQADPKREKFEPYFHLFIQFIDTLSYDNWGGWYNNDGGYGTGTFLVKTDNPRVVIDHYAYVQEEVFEGEFNYSAAAAEDIEDAA